MARKLLLFILFGGIFIVALDIAITGPALPGIKASMNIDNRLLSWVIGVYVFFNLVGTPVIAKLSDSYGKKKLFLFAIFAFLTGSLLVSLSTNFNMLLLGRSIQGIGGGCILPIVSAMIGDYFPIDQRAKVLGISGGIFGLAFICGPLFSGIILSSLSWNYLFLIVLLPGILVFILGWIHLPETGRRKKVKIDWAGLYLLCISLGLFAYGINKIEFSQLNSSGLGNLVFILISILLFFGFVIYQTKTRIPLVRLSLFKTRQVLLACIIAIGVGIAHASFLFVPDMIVDSLNVSASLASWMIMPMVASMAIGSVLAGRLVNITGTRVIILAGLILITAGSFLFTREISTSYILYAGEIMFGTGLSAIVSSALRFIILNESAKSERTMTQGMLNVFLNFGQLVGASLIGAIIASIAVKGTGYHSAFLIIAILGFSLIIPALFLKSKLKEGLS